MSRPRVGYRFLPSDEEIISYFLKHKMDGNDYLVDDDVQEIDLYKHEPWDLPSLCANDGSHDQTWYFFCIRDKNKSHQSRTTKVGYWKSTGQDRMIKNKIGKKVIGTKKTLRFHIGRTPRGKQSEWTIHEYSSSSVLPHQTHFVLCKLMKKNSDKADASACHEDISPGNQPSNNENDRLEILIAPEVDQDRSVSPNLGDSFHPPVMQQLGRTPEEILAFINDNLDKSDGLFNNGYLEEPAGLGPSSAFIQNEQEWADSLWTFTDEHSPQRSFVEFPSAPIVQDGHAVARPKEYQRRQSVALSGTLPPLKHDENGREKIAVHRGEISEEENSSAVVTADTLTNLPPVFCITRVTNESSSGSTTPGDSEIYANGQEFSEYSSRSSTSPEQEIYFIGQEWPESSGYSTKNRSAGRSQFQRRLSNKSVPKIQKPTAIHLSQKKSSDDSGKMKRLLSESEEDHKMVVAAASSKLRTFMSSLIRFETLPTSHRQNPPSVYIANVLVGLVLFVVISREMLIFH